MPDYSTLDIPILSFENATMARVTIDRLAKVFKGPRGEDLRAVDNASLAVEDREFLVLVGPSGCGKSTTLRLIAGLEEPSAGSVSLDGQVVNGVAPKDRDIGMVFQNHALYPHMTVFENLAFGLKLRKVPHPEIESRVAEAAAMLGLQDCLGRRPAELSGGQRQRAAVGRAIVRKPKVFLFDEPFSNLDAPLRAQMRREISRLHRQLGSTMIYVTHDQAEAMTMGDRIAVMKSGAIQQVDEPMNVYRLPANLFVAGFIGSPPMNLFRGRLVARDGGLFFEEQAHSPADSPTAAGAPPAVGGPFTARLDNDPAARLPVGGDRPIVLGLRPEDIQPLAPGSANGSSIDAVAEFVEPIGPETHLHANTGAHAFVVRSRDGSRFEPGRKLALAFDMSRARFFDPHSGNALA